MTPSDHQQHPSPEHPEMIIIPPRRSRWTLLPICVIFVVAIMLVTLLANDSDTPKQHGSVAANAGFGQVVITNHGFEPATIRIKAGQSVVWSNQDSANHQVATDPYPSEDKLHGFVDPTPLLEGDTYSFTFEKAGIYTYHDHLNPLSLQGTVIVTR